MNLKLKGVIPKFRYPNILGEINVPTKIAPRPENPEVTGRAFDDPHTTIPKGDGLDITGGSVNILTSDRFKIN